MNQKCVVLNAGLVNYDGNIDYSHIAPIVKIYEHTNEDKILERIQGYDIVVTKEMPVRKEIIEAFPDCVKLLCEAGTGYNNIDIEAANKKGILVCNTPAYSTQRVAHTVILMLLNLASSMNKQIKMLACKNHDNFHKHLMVDHIEVNDKTLGIIGYGNIGKEVIKVAQAMGMHILVSTLHPREDINGIHFTSLEEVLKQSDFISLHCPLNENTRHIINKDTLALMKSSAFIINTARGALIDEKALIQALENNTIAGAGLDVQEVEPLAHDSPLYDMDNVVLTPHMGWRGLETRKRLVNLVKKNIDAYLNGAPINIVQK